MASTPRPRSMTIMAWRALMEAQERVMVDLRVALGAHGLSISDFDVLVNLAPGASCRHKELAERVVLSRTGLTRLVDRLIARGLVVRCPDEHDGRGVCVRLTDAGVALRAEALATNADVVMAAFTGMGADDVETLHGLVDRIGRPSS